MTAPATPAVVLVGPPGSGKSTVGRLLAERLGLPFQDTDTAVEQLTGKSVADLFVEEGEPHFRRLERNVVRAAATGFPGVLALGGGAVMAEESRALLGPLPVVFLEVPLGDAVKRVGLDAPRPLLAVNPRARWRELMEARRPLYLEVATAVVATEGRTPEQVADAVLEALEWKAPHV
ncbi:shikimate kinase [Kitasatospora sp. NPDC088134]|uniref:shikimate kinase n=1 Tax=Kitasatospora sp. NPDC088134 TaxID=3364071 RepID=UPI003802E195